MKNILITGASGWLGINLIKTFIKGIDLLIGPEGGFSKKEIQSAREFGFSGISLGPRILRTETASLAAISIIQAEWGDFKT